MNDKTTPIIAGTQISIGSLLAYKGISHGLPRTLGLRTEFHITNQQNAEKIRKDFNYLNPLRGGKNGFSEYIGKKDFIIASEDFVHITGKHKDSPSHFLLLTENYKIPKCAFWTLYRRLQRFLYESLINYDDVKKFQALVTKRIKSFLPELLKLRLTRPNKATVFYICGTDDYFNKNFISDTDDVALKASNLVKVYNTRLSAMVAALKEHGLSGIKQNKLRVAVGATMLLTLGGGGIYLISKGVKKLVGQNKPESDFEQTTPPKATNPIEDDDWIVYNYDNVYNYDSDYDD